MLKKSFFTIVTVVAFLSLFNLFAQDYYISPTGDDTSGTGVLSNPWQTFQKGLDALSLSGGDTLYLRGGTYSLSANPIPTLDYVTGTNGTTTIKNYNNESVLFDGAGVASKGLILNNCKKVTVQGLDWKDIHNSFEIKYCENLTVKDCDISDSRGEAIQIKYTTDVLVENCKIGSTGIEGYTYAEGIYIGESTGGDYSDRITIKKCTIFGTFAECINVKGDVFNVTIDDCKFLYSVPSHGGAAIAFETPINRINDPRNHVIKNSSFIDCLNGKTSGIETATAIANFGQKVEVKDCYIEGANYLGISFVDAVTGAENEKMYVHDCTFANVEYIGYGYPDGRKLDVWRQFKAWGSLTSGASTSWLYNANYDNLTYLDCKYYFKFEDDANDSSGWTNNGTVAGTPAYTTGNVGSKAIVLDGNDDGIDFGTPDDLTKSLTIAFWVKVDLSLIPTGSSWLLGTSPYDEFSIRLFSAGRLYYMHGASPGFTKYLMPTNTIPDDKWVHIAIVRTVSGNTGILKTFVNGIPVSTESWTSSDAQPRSTSKNLKLGTVYGANHPGTIDDLRIYDYAVDEHYVFDLYMYGNTALHYKCDGMLTGLKLADVSYLHGDGILIKQQMWGDGVTESQLRAKNPKLGINLLFDGVEDFVDCGTVPGDMGGDLTISLMLKPDLTNGPSHQALICMGGPKYEGYFKVMDSGIMYAYHSEDGGSGYTSFKIADAGTVPDDVWSHLVITRDISANEYKVYIDGVLKKTTSFTTDPVTGGSYLYIGKYGNQFYKGRMDEIRLYKEVLSQDAITRLYKLMTAVNEL
ncbi:MAG: right-handed parallel beta-helix repeat-containing protein [Victivallaceae bacterium]|nr:right-handed parallel beta-helix repeat-containing protein [Victivallaceae bacterium]